MSQVFISYSRQDNDMASEVCKILDRNNIPYFLDTKNINWGAEVNKDVRGALSDCVAIVVIISPASIKSQWVAYELGHAKALNKIILPLLSHPSIDIPSFIHELNYKTSISEVDKFFSGEYLKLFQEQANADSNQTERSRKAFLSDIIEFIEKITDKSVSKRCIEALKFSLRETELTVDTPSAKEVIDMFHIPYFALLNHDIILNSSSAKSFLYSIRMFDSALFKKLLSSTNYSNTFNRNVYSIGGKNIFTYSEIMRMFGIKKEMFFVPKKLKS
ncbi:MAG: toll/interleukin-1 receptor domain-containing protein [Candidatus Electronema sp. VV]